MPDWATEVRKRLAGLALSPEREADIVNELSQHLDDHWQELIARGASPDEATLATLAEFQNGDLLRQHMAHLRQAHSTSRITPGAPKGHVVSALWQDIRFAVRSLWRRPAFAALTLTILALAIGANTAIFSMVNGVVLQPLPYPHPERLMYMSSQFPALGFTDFAVSPPEYLDLREIQHAFADVGAYRVGDVNLTAGMGALRVPSASVDEHLLGVLGVVPEQGRGFATGETDSAAMPGGAPGPPPPPPPVAILSHDLWQTAFGGRPVLGEMIEVDGRRVEVIGVMPTGFDVADNHTQIWLPLGLDRGTRQNRAGHNLFLIGRLKDGLTSQAARAELDLLNAQWASRLHLSPNDHIFATGGPNVHVLQMTPLQDQIIGSTGRLVWVLQAAVGFVLLVAGANLASLLLARAETRHWELALLTALGASRRRLVQQFLIESTLLSLLGGALGAVLAKITVPVLVRAFPSSLPRANAVAVDLPVLLFTVGVSVATGILFGLAPLVHTRVTEPVMTLKEGGSKGATGGARHRLRSAIVIAQVAVAVVLVSGAALLGRTVYNLTQVDAGFDRTHQMTFAITLPRARYAAPGTRVQMLRRLLDTLRAVPGIRRVSAMSGLPPNRPRASADLEIERDTAPPPPSGPPRSIDYLQAVASDYFETMSIAIVKGRSFQPADAGPGDMVTIINQTLANTFWGAQSPIGQRLRPCCGDQIPWFTVVGVARDVKQGGLDRRTGTEMYIFSEQASRFAQPATFLRPGLLLSPVTMNIVLRTSLPTASLRPTIETAVQDIDPDVPVVHLQEMADVFRDSIRRPRLLAQLVAAFGSLSLLLAAIGTYGLLSVMIAERRVEIGIRMALGADRLGVLLVVLKEGLLHAALGIGIGMGATLVLTRLLSSLLFGVRPTDLATLVAVAATIMLVALLACVRPAWLASRLDPNAVLRN